VNEVRAKGVACRCSLLIGSFEGSDYCCPCHSADACKLSASERVQYQSAETVQAARARNYEQFTRGRNAGDSVE